MDRLSSGELAKNCRVNLETIRYYERRGLLPKPPRTQSGYRLFSRDAVRRVRFIKRSQELGFSLREIKELLGLRIRPNTTCADVRKQAETKIADIKAKIQGLRSMQQALERLTAACSGGSPVSECPILESLDPEEG
ncbi:MAG: MerR family transcriptional regulator [Acidobacteria bacterium]|nr:MerR family transcriptional regulator [Acidobacteriota bacterium]MCI0719084.1 MerR family transcriptional regulator [Acidobacteriota bacterium]